MYILTIGLVGIAIFLIGICFVVQKLDYFKAHPSHEAQVKALNKAWSMNKISDQDYQQQLDALLRKEQ